MADLVDYSPELARLRLEALYRRDHRGRLVSVNEWNGGAAPRFHLISVPWSRTTVLFLFVPASASRMRFTKPG
jgi:hypothetical protein